jgi:undecaprenyl pyrophosphate phosphatase UppP
MAGAFAAGAGASFVSTLLSTRAIRAVERDRPLTPYVVYRLALAGAVLARARRRAEND